RPRMFCARAFFISCSLVWSARDAERDPLLRVAAACLAESLRSADLACDDFFWPEPPLRLPPPDCLLTVAQARGFRLLAGYALALVAFLDVFGLAFLLVGVLVFIALWHGGVSSGGQGRRMTLRQFCSLRSNMR